MCTVTIQRNECLLRVTVNRDELRGRPAEGPPEIFETDEGCWAGPRDPAGGGTWMGVNDRGVVACLLNRYLKPPPDRQPGGGERPSRGAIVPECLRRGDAELAVEWLSRSFDPSPYADFTLVVASGCAVWEFGWDGGGQLQERSLPLEWEILSSSSWCQQDVIAWRRSAFEQWREDGSPFAGALPLYHLLQPPDRAQWAPLMRRDRSATWSITQARVNADPGPAHMLYWPVEGLDPHAPAAEITLARRESVSYLGPRA